MQKQLADRLRAVRASGLARQQDLDVASPQRLGKQARLGRLAGPFPALEGDEPAAAHVNRPSTPLSNRCAMLACGTASAATSGTSCGSWPGIDTRSQAICW